MSQLPEMVQALLDPRVYPDVPPGVEMVQTQMSFVFLTGDYVYKVKKPVNLGYLDYTTLDKRRFFCQRELELNQRLCPDTYLAVVPITREKGGFMIDGKGKAIEYAVKMRHLPREMMMDVLLAANRVSVEMVVRVAQKLAAFHRQAETNETISSFGEIDTVSLNTEENFDQTVKYIGKTISQPKYRRIKAYAMDFID
ncbi:MAG: hypothetical protein HYU83_01295, partial [Chloroflexi bacterium]|nr:hypothetical protein [Chloroflexota bacterium]